MLDFLTLEELKEIDDIVANDLDKFKLRLKQLMDNKDRTTMISKGYLKEDLYNFDNTCINDFNYTYFTLKEKELNIKSVMDGFKLVAKKGEEFILRKNGIFYINKEETVYLSIKKDEFLENITVVREQSLEKAPK